WVEPLNYMDALEEAVKTLHRAAVPVSIYNHQLCLLPEKLWPFSRKSISSWKNIYFEFCNECSAKNMCGGLFFSSQNKHSNHLHPLK
ncbi:MAG: His-Xaa-Ser system radical SAM maturase HxsC, partial [Candidatus Nanoarchaeia archaeon]